MAADFVGCNNNLKTVLTFEGNLYDPNFPSQLNKVICSLNVILGKIVKISKLEPWNSVRVTLSIPREAALRLRQLANEGSQLLKTLGILSIQVEGDQVISLRIATLGAEPQEITLRTTQDGQSTSSNNQVQSREYEGLARLFNRGGICGDNTTVVNNSDKVQFKSPNVVCPSDSVVPKVVNSTTMSKNPFPFTSMNQAIHCRDNNNQTAVVPNVPPPPYPSSQNPPVSLSSPLLVNLLQNDGPDNGVSSNSVKFKRSRTLLVSNSAVTVNLPPNQSQQTKSCSSNVSPSALSNKHHTNVSTSNSHTHNIVLPLATVDSVCNDQIMRPTPPLLPPPPPYPSTWSSPTHLPDITPSLTVDDLDQLLPSIEHDLVHSPSDLPELLSNNNESEVRGKHFLINPLTGELEPHSSEDELDEDVRDVFTDLPSPTVFSDDDTSSTSKTDTLNNTESDSSDTRSSLIESGVKHRLKSKQDKGRDSPSSLKPTEKIKLRLKLEKSEPVNPAYKVDVSFINTQQPKKALVTSAAIGPLDQNSEGLRVPPLHISLRGRNLVITNKKRNKLNEGVEKVKVRKVTQDYSNKEEPSSIAESDTSVPSSIDTSTDQSKLRLVNDAKKMKRPKLTHELISQDSKLFLNYQVKERRSSSDSEVTKNTTNGIISDEKKRCLNQSDVVETGAEISLGSTNVGTLVGLNKPRKVKNRELNRNKSYSKNLAEKLAKQQQLQIALPTGEIDMEAKFKQRLMEGHMSPHRTEQITGVASSNDENNTPERKEDKPLPVPNRSPNNGAQGEDSGIESMDALSEKSPNQASQSPHADINDSTLKTKTQVPDMLDIEAQLAKMEGLNGGDECCTKTETQTEEKSEDDPLPLRVAPPLYTYSNSEKIKEENDVCEDNTETQPPVIVKNKSLLEALLIEIPNEHQHNSDTALSPATRSVRTRASSKLNSPENNSPVTRQQRGTTPNKRKRHESDSSNHSTSDDVKKKTRKVNDNENKSNTKRSAKNHDESSDSDEPLIEKMRKSTNQPIVITATTTTPSIQCTTTAITNAINSTSSKNKFKSNVSVAKMSINAPLSTRRSVRTAMPAQNTRSKGDVKVQVDGNATIDAVRRKTRSAVVDMELKRKKEVK